LIHNYRGHGGGDGTRDQVDIESGLIMPALAHGKRKIPKISALGTVNMKRNKKISDCPPQDLSGDMQSNLQSTIANHPPGQTLDILPPLSGSNDGNGGRQDGQLGEGHKKKECPSWRS
jgi:hypothetical protein